MHHLQQRNNRYSFHTYLANVKDTDARFKFLKDLADLRHKQPSGSCRMEEMSEDNPGQWLTDHRYHRVCNSKFTKNIESVENFIPNIFSPREEKTYVVFIHTILPIPVKVYRICEIFLRDKVEHRAQKP